MRNKRVKLWSTVIAAMVLQSSFGLASRAAWPSLGGLAPLAGSGIVSLAAPGELTAVRSAEPISIDSLRLREFEDGEEIQIQASGDIVWTQYRDDRGDLVIELPNTVVADQVSGLDSGGLISSIEIETLPEGERPLTRLVIATSEQSEHSLNVIGDVLLLQFVAQGGAFEPLAVSAPDPQQEPEPLQAPDPQQEPGTPEEPAHGPPPTGVSATQLQGVEVLQAGPEPVIRILGDGEFAYSTFSLADPPRFVIDLEGVVNTSSESTVYVDSPFVDQVRMAQFRPYPQPIARVVLDLRSGLFPVIERDSDGLTLRFEEASVVASEPLDELQADESEVAETQPQDRAVTLAEGPDEQALDEPEQLRTQPVTQPIVEAADLAEIETTAPGAEASSPDDPVDGALQSETLVPLSPQDAEPETTGTNGAQSELVNEISPSVTIVAETGEPLRIRDESQTEAPAWLPEEPAEEPLSSPQPSDVSLFGAQPVTVLDPRSDQATAPGATFGIQQIGQARKWEGVPIDMSLKDADVTEVLRSIARLANLNIVLQPGVSGPVTVEFTQVPWDQVLDAILKVNSLGQQLDGNILRIAPVQQLEQEARQQQLLEQAKRLSVPLTTIMRRISYARAADIARILTRGQRSQSQQLSSLGSFTQTGILSQRGSVSVDERTNTLIIRELPSQLPALIQVIQNLDVPEKQVMIEARVVETTRNFSRSLGVQWNFSGIADARHGNTTGLAFPNNIDATGGVSLLTGGQNGFLNLGFGNILNTFELDIALNAAENDGLVNVISAPKVAVLNNEKASIQTGLQIPIQTIANNTVTVQFVNATLRLDVTPQVTAEGTIMMEIDIQKREPLLAFAVVGATNAPIATREAHTRVIVRDGGTAVIGGIYEVSSSDGSDKVPGLSRIPLLGHLFKNRSRSNTNEELLIFITPRVIHL